jgi:cyanate lyase
MAVEIESHVADNYRKLHAERGLTWEQLAAQTGARDRRLAAWMREQSATEVTDRETRVDPPHGRKRSPVTDA